MSWVPSNLEKSCPRNPLSLAGFLGTRKKRALLSYSLRVLSQVLPLMINSKTIFPTATRGLYLGRTSWKEYLLSGKGKNLGAMTSVWIPEPELGNGDHFFLEQEIYYASPSTMGIANQLGIASISQKRPRKARALCCHVSGGVCRGRPDPWSGYNSLSALCLGFVLQQVS